MSVFGWMKPRQPKPSYFVAETSLGWLACSRRWRPAPIGPHLEYVMCLDAAGQDVCLPEAAPKKTDALHETKAAAEAAIALRREFSGVGK